MGDPAGLEEIGVGCPSYLELAPLGSERIGYQGIER